MNIMFGIEVDCRNDDEVIEFQKPCPSLPDGIVWQVGMKYWDDDLFDASLRTVDVIEVGKDAVVLILKGVRYASSKEARIEFQLGGWTEVESL